MCFTDEQQLLIDNILYRAENAGLIEDDELEAYEEIRQLLD